MVRTAIAVVFFSALPLFGQVGLPLLGAGRVASSSGPVLMSNFAQSLGANGGTTTPGISTTGAALELVKVDANSSGALPATISDSAGNTLSQITGSPFNSGTNRNIAWYYKFNPTTGSSVTWTVSLTSGFLAISVSLYSYSGTFTGSTEGINHAVCNASCSATFGPGATGTLNHTPNEVCEAAAEWNTTATTVTSSVFTMINFKDVVGGSNEGLGSSGLIPASGISVSPTFTLGVAPPVSLAAVACFY